MQLRAHGERFSHNFPHTRPHLAQLETRGALPSTSATDDKIQAFPLGIVSYGATFSTAAPVHQGAPVHEVPRRSKRTRFSPISARFMGAGELVRRHAHVSHCAAPILGTPRLPARTLAACSPNPSAFRARQKIRVDSTFRNIVWAQAEIRVLRSGNVSVCDATLTTVCLPGDQIQASPLESTSNALVASMEAPTHVPAYSPWFRANRRRVQFRPHRVGSWARAPIRAVRAVFVSRRGAQTWYVSALEHTSPAHDVSARFGHWYRENAVAADGILRCTRGAFLHRMPFVMQACMT
ncbi:hypothetical protein C2E23DRAFT_271456 [Lenzites betulinus]|nr:hypothetical protein C2E23DRAFT_271456 [Lenzites betulinus]